MAFDLLHLGFIPVLLLAVSWWSLRSALRKRRSLLLPPGPPGLPIIGNLLDMPTVNMAPVFHNICRKFGDVIYLEVFGKPTIVIDSFDAAMDIMEGRSAVTADRPKLVMADLIGIMWEFVFQNNGPTVKRCRSTFHKFFQSGAVPQYRPNFLQATKKFLTRLLNSPEDFRDHTHWAVGAIVMDVIYGIDIAEKDDKFVKIAERETDAFGKIIVPGRYLVELFPSLAYVPAWLPGAKFKRDAKVWTQDVLALRNVPYDAAVEAIVKGSARPSVTSMLHGNAMEKDGRVSPEDIEHFKDVVGIAYPAGVDTTFGTMMHFFLAMVNHPDVQQKAWAELDAVVGPDHLPTFEDRDSLPYINAIVKETMRWHSIVPLGIAHLISEDMYYKNYCLPKGAVLIPNNWSMSRDPSAYSDPERFIPERFLKDGKLNDDVRDPFKYQFGFGRRICPGRYFANEALYMLIASVLHVFNIQPALDENGKPMKVETEIPLDVGVAHPKPFPCIITPRSTQAEDMLRKLTLG